MAVLKNKLQSDFTQIPNDIIEDSEIKSNDFRVLCYLYSKPDGWNVNNKDIMNRFNIKSDSTLSQIWKRLITVGYIKRVEVKDNGKFKGYDYELFVSKSTDSKKTTNGENISVTESSDSEKTRNGTIGGHSNTEFNSNTDISNTDKEVSFISIVTEIIDFLNQTCSRKFRVTDSNKRLIKNLLKKNYSAENLKEVVQFKFLEWGGDKKFREYLRPSTLFRISNFENYFEAVERERSGEKTIISTKVKKMNRREELLKSAY